jgi:hypothetical protein
MSSCDLASLLSIKRMSLACNCGCEIVITSQGLAIDSLHREVNRLRLQRVHLLIELGRAMEALVRERVDISDYAFEPCRENPCGDV